MWWREDKGPLPLLSILLCPLAVEAIFLTAWSLLALRRLAADVTQDTTLLSGGGPLVLLMLLCSPSFHHYLYPTPGLAVLPCSWWWWNGHSGSPWKPHGRIIASQHSCLSSFSHQDMKPFQVWPHAPRNRKISLPPHGLFPTFLIQLKFRWHIGGMEASIQASISCFNPLLLWTKD